MHRLFLLFIILIFNSCIDEISLTTGGDEQKLVVDGWLSNDVDLSYIQVYYSAPFTSGNFFINFKSPDINSIFVEAKSDGKVYNYLQNRISSDNSPPRYTPEIRFDIIEGESYRLNIILANGTHYQSNWQEVLPKSNDFAFEYGLIQKIVFINRAFGPAMSQLQYFMDLEIKISDVPEKNIGYYLKSSGIEELITSSGSDNCSCICYLHIPNVNKSISVKSNSSNSRGAIHLGVGHIPMARFFKFYVDVDIYATSLEGASYLDQISRQQTNTGSIFDPAPFKIKGNIQNLFDPEEEVLGNFFTANHSNIDLMIDRAVIRREHMHLDFNREAIPEVVSRCTEYYSDAVTTRPFPFR